MPTAPSRTDAPSDPASLPIHPQRETYPSAQSSAPNAPLPADFGAALRCPCTRQPLTLGEAAALEVPAWTELRTRFGLAAPTHVLRTTDGTHAYPVWPELIVLEAQLAWVCGGATESRRRAEKQVVADFYDRYGWVPADGGDYQDALAFEDLRPLTASYRRRCHRRVDRHLDRGRYLLDAASGAVQLQEYVDFSKNFTYRICVDLSLAGLLQAKRRLGDHAICVLADITALPFADGFVDAFVSLHTIYHVPADEQGTAVAELYRVLRPGGPGVLVYSWGGRAPLLKRYRGLVERRKAKLAAAAVAAPPELYFHPHDYAWYEREIAARYPVKLRVWRSVEKEFLENVVRSRLDVLLWLWPLYLAEELLPRLFGRLGIGPMFVFAKPEKPA